MRAILYPVRINENFYRRKINAEILEALGGKNIVSFITRMNPHAAMRGATEWNPGMKRARGRLRTRWLVKLDFDLKMTGIKVQKKPEANGEKL